MCFEGLGHGTKCSHIFGCDMVLAVWDVYKIMSEIVS